MYLLFYAFSYVGQEKQTVCFGKMRWYLSPILSCDFVIIPDFYMKGEPNEFFFKVSLPSAVRWFGVLIWLCLTSSQLPRGPTIQ